MRNLSNYNIAVRYRNHNKKKRGFLSKKVFLSLRETPRHCEITENTPNHQIVYHFFYKNIKNY